MHDNIVKTPVSCKTDKRFENFYWKKSECKECNIKASLKRYHSNEKNLKRLPGKCFLQLEGLRNWKNFG